MHSQLEEKGTKCSIADKLNVNDMSSQEHYGPITRIKDYKSTKCLQIEHLATLGLNNEEDQQSAQLQKDPYQYLIINPMCLKRIVSIVGSF